MSKEINFIVASVENAKELAKLNKKLIDCGGSNNNMTIEELENRMRDFISDKYIAIIFEVDSIHLGYTLVDVQSNPMFIRQFFIEERYRRQGYGTAAFNKLIHFLNIDKVNLSVLVSNNIGYEFWKSCDLEPYEIFMHYKKQ